VFLLCAVLTVLLAASSETGYLFWVLGSKKNPLLGSQIQRQRHVPRAEQLAARFGSNESTATTTREAWLCCVLLID
jgi:hypothetical protein